MTSPDTQTPTAQRTPGALRAAVLIENLRYCGQGDIGRYATIIDRETAAPDLLAVADYLCWAVGEIGEAAPDEDNTIMVRLSVEQTDAARAAIAKARPA